MNSSHRPIDYTGFSPTPQRLQVKVSGFVPKTGWFYEILKYLVKKKKRFYLLCSHF